MDEIPTDRLLPAGQLGRWLSEKQDMWQMSLLNPRKLARFIRDRGLSIGQDHIERLWQLALVKADLVVSQKPLNVPGLLYICQDEEEGSYFYADERLPIHRAEGWTDALSDTSDLDSEIKLLFHPFRFYVLYKIREMIGLNIAAIQIFRAMKYPKMVELYIKNFEKRSSEPEFIERVQHWNEVAAFAIATEPATYAEIYHHLSHPVDMEIDEQRQRTKAHGLELHALYKEIGQDKLEELRQDICVTRDCLDDNDALHTIIRLSDARFRDKIKGAVGGAMVLNTMAEMLRRLGEKAFATKLPEEDELGFGWWPAGARENLYGSDRLLDGNNAVVSEFMRQHDLDYGIRARWYVEGPTEYHSIKTVFDDWGVSYVQLIDLEGRVVEKSTKVLRIHDSLKGDLAANHFSLISIDGDTPDNERAVKKAAQDDVFCGMFFIARPDFEMHNFKLAELEEILWGFVEQEVQIDGKREMLHKALEGSASGKEVIERAQTALVELIGVGKGEEWGKHLIEYAYRHPLVGPEIGPPSERPIINQINIALRTRSFDFHHTRKENKTDPKTGEMIKREQPASNS